MKSERILSALGYAGLIPFVAGCVISALGDNDLGRAVFLSYSATILSFLGGTLWGRLIANPALSGQAVGLVLLGASNGFALLGWLALVLSFSPVQGPALLPFVCLTLGFVLLFFCEIRGLPRVAETIHRRYSAFRAFLTVTVLLLHGVFFLLQQG